MAIVPLTDPVDADQLNANFDDLTSEIIDQAADGQRDNCILMFYPSLPDTIAAGTPVQQRSFAFLIMDDQVLEWVVLRVTSNSAGDIVIGRLYIDDGNGDNEQAFMTDNRVRIVLTTVVGTVDSRSIPVQGNYSQVDTLEGPRLKTLKGIRYRLDLETNDPVSGPIMMIAQVRGQRRRT